jgi:hypothetical protein
MDVSGTVHTQCNHIFVVSCVDLQTGERYVYLGGIILVPSVISPPHRFCNTDYALALALRDRFSPDRMVGELAKEVEDIDLVNSYDCACQYEVNLLERFETSFPDIYHLVKRMRWCIPALHIQGHKEGCLYEYSSSYKECVAHFFGETSEMYWAEINQQGPQTRQMNNGRRQDTLMDSHGDWNWKKMAKMCK